MNAILAFGRLYRHIADLLTTSLEDISLLLLRLAGAKVFIASGLTKWDGWFDFNDLKYDLFLYEFFCPDPVRPGALLLCDPQTLDYAEGSKIVSFVESLAVTAGVMEIVLPVLLILINARANKVPPALVKAVIAAESRFDSTAVSRAGAQGLMQLMPKTARELGIEDPFRPSENVKGGTRYLRSMLDRYGDMTRALAAYNAGPNAVDYYRGVPPYPETQAYVRRVLTYYRHYDGDFGY